MTPTSSSGSPRFGAAPSGGAGTGSVALVAAQGSGEGAKATGTVIGELLDAATAAGEPTQISLLRGISLYPADLVPADPRVRVISSGLLGSNLEIWKRGQLDLVPEAVSRFPSMLRSGRLGCETLILRTVAHGTGYASGLVSDYVPAALDVATEVVVEICDDMPTLEGAPQIPRERVTRVVRSAEPLPEFDAGRELSEDRAVAALVAGLVEDCDCVEIGVGGLGRAIARELATRRRRLSVHTGLVNDDVLDLIDSGAVTNEANTLEPGKSVTAVAMGTEAFYRRLRGRRDIVLRPVDFTNNPLTIAGIDRFVAINSAVEADLLGQLNAEVVRGRRIGAPGGQVDFYAGARASRGGKAIAVLRATARDGQTSRIVPALSDAVVTGPAGCVDFVVTEYGVADLRGATLAERGERMAQIAHPRFRAELLDALGSDARIRVRGAGTPIVR